MPAPGPQSTFDGNPLTSPPTTTPYRPGTSDFNSLSLIDDSEYPPDPTMPTANLMNSEAATLIVYGRLVQNLTMSITYSGGNPQVDSFTASPTAVATQPASSTFTIVRTPGGIAVDNFTNGGHVGVRIVTVNMSNAATDLPFTFDLM